MEKVEELFVPKQSELHSKGNTQEYQAGTPKVPWKSNSGSPAVLCQTGAAGNSLHSKVRVD